MIEDPAPFAWIHQECPIDRFPFHKQGGILPSLCLKAALAKIPVIGEAECLIFTIGKFALPLHQTLGVGNFVAVEKQNVLNLFFEKKKPNHPSQIMPVGGRVQAVQAFLFVKWKFDKLGVAIFRVDEVQGFTVFFFSIEKMVADRDDGLFGNGFNRFDAVPQKRIIVAAKINDGSELHALNVA